MINFAELLKQIQESESPEDALMMMLWNWYDQGYHDCVEEMGERGEEN